MLQVVTGGMFAGKTDELLRRLERYIIANRKVVLVRPDTDTRDSITHNGKEFKGINVKRNDYITFKQIVANNDVIGIDEAQFFEEPIYWTIKNIIQNGADKIIIVSGLDMDYSGEPFGIMPQLMAIADEVVKLHAVCEDCYKAANVSYRTTGQRDQVVVGGKSEYKALCWACAKQTKQ